MLKIPTPGSIAARPQLAALRHRDYRHTWAANMFSGAAMWTMFVAVGWMALDRSDSSGWVGIIAFSSMIPFLVVSPVAGFMADRLDRRNLAVASLVGSSLTLAVLAALAVAGVAELWHVAVMVFVSGAFRAIFDPTVQALIPNQVPREDLLNAFTLSAATRHGAKLILIVVSPLLAVGFVSIEGVLVLSAFLQLIGAVLMSRTRTVSRGESAPEHGLARNIVDGLVHIYTNRTIALFIVLVAFHCALVMSFDSILPVLSREELGATDASVYGYLVVAFGAGSVIGLLLIAGIRDDARKGQVLMWTAVASGLTPIILAVSGNVPLAIVASAAMGASQATFMALTNTYVQTIAPDRLRGRIASLYTLHAGGIMAFSNLGYGFMADVFSAPRVLFVTGVLFVVFLVALSAGQPALRRVYRTGEVVAA